MPRVVPPGVKVICLEGFIASPGKAAAAGELVEVVNQRVADSLIERKVARLPTPEELAAPPQPKTLDNSDRRKR